MKLENLRLETVRKLRVVNAKGKQADKAILGKISAEMQALSVIRQQIASKAKLLETADN